MNRRLDSPPPFSLLRVAVVIALVTIVVTIGLSWLDDQQRPPACTVRLFPDHSWRIDGEHPAQSPRRCAVVVVTP